MVNVLQGNIAAVKADALITAINSAGAWFGGIDNVIQSVAGNMFHGQAKNAMPLNDGQVVIARSDSQHRGQFRHVVFVVDDLQRPLHEIVLAGLRGADEAGFTSVALPTIRMGVMLGMVEKKPGEATAEMVKAIDVFLSGQPKSVKGIAFVVYNDPEIANLLRADLAELIS